MSTSSSWYRRTIWNYKGNKEYTRTGFEAASTRFVADDLDVDCTDRHYMITGCNSGIGLQTALEVAKRGGVIHMVCRNPEAANRARSEIITTTGNDKIHLHIVDLSRPREVILWAQRFAAQHEHLHALINNAGCMVHERKEQDGVETNFAVNTLAVHIITITLMPLLERSEDSRVVIVSSAGMLCVRLDPHDLMHVNMDPFDGRLIYSQNKRQQVVMGLWYAQRYNKVHFSSMHPGWADTEAVRTSIPQFYEMMKDNLRTAGQGADTVVWLAISKAATKHPSGLFFQDREPVSTHLPLAWTKSTIEEEDLLMTNIQDIYLRIHNQMFPSTDTQEAGSSTSQSEAVTTAAAAASAGAGGAVGSGGLKSNKEEEEEEAKLQQSASRSSKDTEEGKTKSSSSSSSGSSGSGGNSSNVQETSLTEQPALKRVAPEPPVIPVLPPPPPPAIRITEAKSEVVQGEKEEKVVVVQTHDPPASIATQEKGKEDTEQGIKGEEEPREGAKENAAGEKIKDDDDDVVKDDDASEREEKKENVEEKAESTIEETNKSEEKEKE